MAEIELRTRTADDSIEMIEGVDGTKFRVSADIQASANAVPAVQAGLADHEARIDALEAGGGGGAPTGPAGGDLGGTYPNPTVSLARGLRETTGPTTLTMGAVADGQVLTRSGTSIVGSAGGGGSPTGSAGGDLGGTYPNPTVTQARGIRETSGPTTLAAGAIADGQALVRSGSAVVGVNPNALPWTAGFIPSWVEAAAAVGISTEFNFDPGWLYYDTTNSAARTLAGGAPNEFSNLAGSTSVPRVSFSQKRGCVRLQMPNTGADQQGIYYAPALQTPTLPVWYWCNIAGKYASSGGAAAQALLCLLDNASGVPTRSDFNGVGISNNGGGANAYFVSRVANTETPTGVANSTGAPLFEWFGLYKTSTTCFGFGVTFTGQWHRLGAVTDSRTSFWVGFWLRANQTSSVGSDPLWIFESDFVRQAAGTIPPWVRSSP